MLGNPVLKMGIHTAEGELLLRVVAGLLEDIVVVVVFEDLVVVVDVCNVLYRLRNGCTDPLPR